MYDVAGALRGAAPLERFAATRPRAPYCADTFPTPGVTIRSREVALTMRYVQVGGPVRSQAYLVFDIDRADAERAWQEAGLPRPTFSVTNPANGHAHLFWELAIPVTLYPFGRQVRYLEAVQRGMTARLKADNRFVGLVAQNPLSDSWTVQVEDVRSDLPTLGRHLSVAEMSDRPVRISGLGRNCDLFDATRFEAYATVREFADQASFTEAVRAYAIAKNKSAFERPLFDQEIRSIVKSVSGWTWERRERFSAGRKVVRRGAMGFDPLPPVMEATKRLEAVRDRKATAAKATHEARAASTRARIASAVLDLKNEEKRVSAASVARRTGISEKTVRKHRDLLSTAQNPVVCCTQE